MSDFLTHLALQILGQGMLRPRRVGRFDSADDEGLVELHEEVERTGRSSPHVTAVSRTAPAPAARRSSSTPQSRSGPLAAALSQTTSAPAIRRSSSAVQGGFEKTSFTRSADRSPSTRHAAEIPQSITPAISNGALETSAQRLVASAQDQPRRSPEDAVRPEIGHNIEPLRQHVADATRPSPLEILNSTVADEPVDLPDRERIGRPASGVNAPGFLQTLREGLPREDKPAASAPTLTTTSASSPSATAGVGSESTAHRKFEGSPDRTLGPIAAGVSADRFLSPSALENTPDPAMRATSSESAVSPGPADAAPAMVADSQAIGIPARAPTRSQGEARHLLSEPRSHSVGRDSLPSIEIPDSANDLATAPAHSGNVPSLSNSITRGSQLAAADEPARAQATPRLDNRPTNSVSDQPSLEAHSDERPVATARQALIARPLNNDQRSTATESMQPARQPATTIRVSAEHAVPLKITIGRIDIHQPPATVVRSAQASKSARQSTVSLSQYLAARNMEGMP